MNEWMKLMFGPFWAGNRLCARFEGDGGGEGGGGGDGGDGGDGDVAGPDWLHEDFELSDLASNQDVRKSMSKYKSHAEQVRGHVELQKQFRNSFRVPNSLDDAKPEDVAKITGRLKGILKPEHVRALVDAPDKPDGYELVRPKMPEGLEYDEASEASLRAWGVKHGIGNMEYDAADMRALKIVAGQRAYSIPTSSIKGTTGQPFAAGGAWQTTAACMTMQTGIIAPTRNYTTPDPECDLDCVPNKARMARVDTVLVNSHSFGGTHSAMIIRRFDERGERAR